jgi:periplasmic protein TonB
MLRLRTTTTLSLLALGVGITGTQWLSDQSGGSAEAVAVHAPHHAKVARVAAHVARRLHATPHPSAFETRTHSAVAAAAVPIASHASGDDAISWVPISMPLSSIPFDRVHHHDVGNLVLHLVVDGQGQVRQVTLAQSSGDDVLDANALVMARQWRFAVPANHPYGFSGDLPLNFASANNQVAETP